MKTLNSPEQELAYLIARLDKGEVNPDFLLDQLMRLYPGRDVSDLERSLRQNAHKN